MFPIKHLIMWKPNIHNQITPNGSDTAMWFMDWHVGYFKWCALKGSYNDLTKMIRINVIIFFVCILFRVWICILFNQSSKLHMIYLCVAGISVRYFDLFLGKHIKCKTICFIMHMRKRECNLDYLNMQLKVILILTILYRFPPKSTILFSEIISCYYYLQIVV